MNLKFKIRNNKATIENRYHSAKVKQVAIFQMNLPHLCTSHKVMEETFNEESTIYRHDIIFDRNLCEEMQR